MANILERIKPGEIQKALDADRAASAREWAKQGRRRVAGQFKDSFEKVMDATLRQTGRKKLTWYQKIAQKMPYSQKLGEGMQKLNQFKWFKNLPGWMKWGIPLQAIMGTFATIGGFTDGFANDQGNFISKTMAGIGGGLKALVKSTLSFGASTWAGIALPLLAGARLAGPWGIALSIAGSIAGAALMDGITNTLMPNRNKSQQPYPNGYPQQQQPYPYRPYGPQQQQTSSSNPFGYNSQGVLPSGTQIAQNIMADSARRTHSYQPNQYLSSQYQR